MPAPNLDTQYLLLNRRIDSAQITPDVIQGTVDVRGLPIIVQAPASMHQRRQIVQPQAQFGRTCPVLETTLPLVSAEIMAVLLRLEPCQSAQHDRNLNCLHNAN
jgi:hypothetical protein